MTWTDDQEVIQEGADPAEHEAWLAARSLAETVDGEWGSGAADGELDILARYIRSRMEQT